MQAHEGEYFLIYRVCLQERRRNHLREVVKLHSALLLQTNKQTYHDDIEVFRQDKPEVYKLLKHILESDAKVMKAQADATEIKVIVCHDQVQFPSKQKA